MVAEGPKTAKSTGVARESEGGRAKREMAADIVAIASLRYCEHDAAMSEVVRQAATKSLQVKGIDERQE